jgi:hypothetical protein
MEQIIAFLLPIVIGTILWLIYLAVKQRHKPKIAQPMRVGISADMRIIPTRITLDMTEDLSFIRELTATEFLFMQMHYSEYACSPLLHGDIVILKHKNPDRAETYLLLDDITLMIAQNRKFIYGNDAGIGHVQVS